jgi:hypothetical protein
MQRFAILIRYDSFNIYDSKGQFAFYLKAMYNLKWLVRYTLLGISTIIFWIEDLGCMRRM